MPSPHRKGKVDSDGGMSPFDVGIMTIIPTRTILSRLVGSRHGAKGIDQLLLICPMSGTARLKRWLSVRVHAPAF